MESRLDGTFGMQPLICFARCLGSGKWLRTCRGEPEVVTESGKLIGEVCSHGSSRLSLGAGGDSGPVFLLCFPFFSHEQDVLHQGIDKMFQVVLLPVRS